MARFTKIPESNLAGTLGTTLGKSTGTLLSKAKDKVGELEQKAKDTCIQVAKDQAAGVLSEAYKTIETIETGINVVKQTLSGVETGTNTLKTTANSVKIATTALEVSIAVVKALPAPMATLPLSMAVLEAEILQTLSETVAQIEQIVGTLGSIVDTVMGFVQKIRDMVSRVEKILDSLKISKALDSSNLSDKNRADLKQRGLINDAGQNIFSEIGQNLGDKGTIIIWYGDTSGIDRTATITENKVLSTQHNREVDINLSSFGDWICYAYVKSTGKPNKPDTQNTVPEGWTSVEPLVEKDWWYVQGTASGLTDKVYGWSDVKAYADKEIKFPGTLGSKTNYTGQTKTVLVLRPEEATVDPKLFDLNKTYALVFSNADAAYNFMLQLLKALDSIKGLQDQLIGIEANSIENNTPVSGDYFRAKNGELYRLEIVNDPKSPKIAQMRYVVAYDSRDNIVYTGSKSFTTNNEVLLTETKVRLAQLLS